MKSTEWISSLIKEEILTESIRDGKPILHLKTPCMVHISEEVLKELKENYEPRLEKGGVLVARPSKDGATTVLEIIRVIFLENDADHPERQYRWRKEDIDSALMATYCGAEENTFPIGFHTHPTHSDNPAMEIMNYMIQSDTSGQDQKVSYRPIKVGEFRVLMPDCLVLCNGKMASSMFIGFYNGLIAPLEFEEHRNEKISEAMESIFEKMSSWAKEGNNKWWLIAGGAGLLFIMLRYPKQVFPAIMMLAVMSPMWINNEHGDPEYFANVSSGKAVNITFPPIIQKLTS